MKESWLSEETAVGVIKVILVILVVWMIPVALMTDYAQAAALKAEEAEKLVYCLQITTWQPTTFSGIPFYVECEKENVDQWFRLRAKENGQYLKPEGKGFLQAYNIVWVSWPEEFKTQPKNTITFELYTSGPDQIGIKTVSLIADQMFSWNGDTPINPPEE